MWVRGRDTFIQGAEKIDRYIMDGWIESRIDRELVREIKLLHRLPKTSVIFSFGQIIRTIG